MRSSSNNSRLTVLIALFSSVVWFSKDTNGATILFLNEDCFLTDKCDDTIGDAILISGDIEKGDSAKFREIVKRSGLALTRVILRSRGGDVMEAMNIGRDIRKLLLETEGPDIDYDTNQSLAYLGGDHPLCFENGFMGYAGSRFKGTTQCNCASACFLIYVGGAKRLKSYIGIHRVYLDRKDYGRMSLDDAAKLYKEIKRPLIEYLDEMGVSRRYADIMLQTSSTDMYVVKYPEMMSEFVGWIPEIEEWLISKCQTISDKQIEQQMKEAVRSQQLKAFMDSRSDRASCIWDALLDERIKRKQAF